MKTTLLTIAKAMNTATFAIGDILDYVIDPIGNTSLFNYFCDRSETFVRISDAITPITHTISREIGWLANTLYSFVEIRIFWGCKGVDFIPHGHSYIYRAYEKIVNR